MPAPSTPSPTTMRAWTYTHPLTNRSLAQSFTLNLSAPAPPSPLAPDQLLIKVLATSLNPADHKVPALPLLGRFVTRTPASPCMDLCGRVIASGKSGERVSDGPEATAETIDVGDLVFGKLPGPTQFGALAEVAVVRRRDVARVPERWQGGGRVRDGDQGGEWDVVVQFAALPTAGLTAWESVVPYVAGERGREQERWVFINGGSGGTGTFGVQIAKAKGYRVVASCSTGNVEFVKGLGADEVIDYKQVDVVDALRGFVEKNGVGFDLVVDNVGSPKDLYPASRSFLKSEGNFVQVGADASLSMAWAIVRNLICPALLGGGKAHYHVMNVPTKEQSLNELAATLAKGETAAVIERVFGMEQANEAFSAVESGRTKGKIVVRVAWET